MVTASPLIESLLPLVVLLLGGGTLPLIGLIAGRTGLRRLREFWAIAFSTLNLVTVYLLYQKLRLSPRRIMILPLFGRPPLSGCFEVDILGVYMAGCVALLGFLAVVYSYRYMEEENRLTEFYTLILLMMAGMTGVALAGDFFTLFIFWEMMGISSYVLVAFLKYRWGPIEAGFKYLIMSSAGSAFLLLSMSLLYGMGGTLNFAYLSAGIRGVEPSPWLLLLLATLIVGFGVKSAIVPFHTWLPDAHPEAPGPISALLSGIVIETGLYALMRVTYLIFTPSLYRSIFASLAILTMTVANVMALLQNDLKRLLAYSSISQIGYMLIGLSTGTAYGLMGTLLHILNHSLMKGLAFLSAGNITHQTGMRDIEKLRGVGRMMPYTMLCLSISLLGLGGVPTTNGFISKFILFSSAIGGGMPLLALAGVLNSALSMAYYLRVMKNFISTPGGELEAEEAPPLMVAVNIFMALLIILLGVWPQPAIRYAGAASRMLVEGLDRYVQAVVGG